MAIVNRDLGSSEQTHMLGEIVSTAVAASAGISYQVCQVPYPCTLKSVAVAAQTISGAPVMALDLKRWTSGGVTTIPYISTTLAVLAYGASAAYQTFSLVTTAYALQAGDVLVLNQQFSGGNVATSNSVITTVVQATQDIKTFFGS